ncbi:restriction endonuclease [Sporosarcina sp. Sa2YVA2]|uniref:Restriction endonuclease n=1 Tax=Sporosarcina quadrami TaxID=2762234 RepID=A0ABR8U555_9BACL|nr:NUMOD3 domain-containing DNA-binding protein [Sporosarcina quadrami]MBD7983176.1 restriction endonuclease [Sporosarcina quadrami]
MNRGYGGFYKGFYLRSSYEYAYAVYLDHYSIPWSYEDQVFNIDGKSYKPDFFFYNQYGNLEKIVEIKSRNKKAREKALHLLKTIEENHQIKTELISYEELLRHYSSMPMTLNFIINNWITSEKTTINKATKGSLNPHYGLKHSEESKRKIGEHTKKLWNSNTEAKKRMVAGLRNSGLSQKGKMKIPRENRFCSLCTKTFTVIQTSTRIYCSRECSGTVAMKNATNVYVMKRKNIHSEIKKYVIQWSLENKEIVLSTPFNKINSTIKPMTEEILYRFDVKDFRVISRAVFGIDKGRKELLKYMKRLCSENVC